MVDEVPNASTGENKEFVFRITARFQCSRNKPSWRRTVVIIAHRVSGLNVTKFKMFKMI